MGWKAVKEHYRIGHFVQVVPDKGICIGSGYIHDIIVISPDGEITKRYDPGHGWSVNKDLARYQSEMEADPETLRSLIAAPDHFEHSITVYTYDGGEIIQCQCEELGWPNVTHDGRMMYENTFSTDRSEVIGWAIRGAEASIEAWTDNVESRRRDLREAEDYLEQRKRDLASLQAEVRDA